ncbi:MAG TPA: stage 0 sporulation family protein [Clostridia bacterium]|nr:stage 0 sporulation family protein [Clostridia bacterium]HPQ47814.1 stage 0 sporulation family protein [Clostridia bacterium]HRX41525.1 stage 0 sporulation family protein [Clostridia bacterium]
MVKIVGIKFDQVGKVYYFSPGEIELKKNDGVIVETAQGIEYGTVVIEPRDIDESEIKTPLKEVQRRATEKDLATIEENKQKEKEAFDLCLDCIRECKLDMKLIAVEYAFDGNKILFHFTADGRVDFRELVKKLAGIFRTRIELRQIGVRDEAKKIGGLGICGRVLCCNSFLDEFRPVSIKMAKNQSLSLNPAKISGVCGRLMCCLKYEHEAYEELLKATPGIGTLVKTADGMGEIIDVSLLKGVVKVKPQQEGGDIKSYALADIEILKRSNKRARSLTEAIDD